MWSVRIEDLMKQDDQFKSRLEEADERMNHWLANRIEEHDNKNGEQPAHPSIDKAPASG